MIQSIRHPSKLGNADVKRLALAVAAGCLIVVALVVYAGFTFVKPPLTGASLDAEAMRIARNLYCPVCPSTPLDVCDTQACVQWRALIREKLAAGQTEEQITQYFVAQYGERVIGAPRAEGFNLGAYVLPFGLLVAGGSFLFITLRSWQRRQRAAPKALPAEALQIAPELAARIARELEEHE
jgi:cytochrome c-type biogenesis protein CcmH